MSLWAHSHSVEKRDFQTPELSRQGATGGTRGRFQILPKEPPRERTCYLGHWLDNVLRFCTGMNSNWDELKPEWHFLELKQTQKTGKVHHMNRLYCRITCHFGICSLKCTFLKRFSFPAIFSRLSNTAKASVDMQNARICHHYTCISACLHLFHK